jgi:hypothetical protein
MATALPLLAHTGARGRLSTGHHPEEVPVSFASEPGRDDGGLPPVNIVVPDDARDLDRDVLAYRRELRARRRRQRLTRFLRPFQAPGFGRHAALIPLIAVCLAVALVGGAVLSVVTMSPAAAPTLSSPAGPAQAGSPAIELAALPPGSVQLDQGPVAVRSLVSSAIAIVPANCDCGIELSRLAGQAADAGVPLIFVGTTQPITQLDALAARYGDQLAVPAADSSGALTRAFHPASLTVLLVFRDANAEVLRDLTANFELSPTLHRLGQPSAITAT